MKRSISWIAVLPSLVIPVCIGLALYLGMLAAIDHQLIVDKTVLRYLIGHWVCKLTIAMFLVGLVSLLMIGFNVFEQYRAEQKIRLEPPLDAADSPVDHAVACGQAMLQLPSWMHEHYLWQRIANALQSIYRTGSAAGVEEELKYLGDLDLERQQQRYALAQILIWATPMLGFLGTVLGISQALGGITVGPENDFQQMMDGLKGSLYVAFDTTALALTLSMMLMFGQFLIERFELQLLQVVDQRARNEIANEFDVSAIESGQAIQADPQLHENIVAAMKIAVETQTEIWRHSIHAAEEAWTNSLSDTHGKIESKLASAIDHSVADLARYLGTAIEKADYSMAHRWEQWQVLLSDNARLMSMHQQRLAEQTELICKLLTQTEETALFEPAISKNQNAIEQTQLLREALADLSSVVGSLAQPAKSDELPESSRSAQTTLRIYDGSTSPGETEAGEVPNFDDQVLPFPIAKIPDMSVVLRKDDANLVPEIVFPFLKKSA